MGGLARLAKQLGHDVSGSDHNIYPPMSDELARLDIPVNNGYEPGNLKPQPALVIIGNTLSRGNKCIEHVLSENLPYISGPQWLAENILIQKQVLAVSGTHGKTTTASMLAWILQSANREPGFLIGGIAENFALSADRGNSELFVVEADEYDTAFFDKRSKFIHYHPDILVINNIEYDHADIFNDIAAIQKEFHHLMKIIPDNGRVIVRDANPGIDEVLKMGCWTPTIHFGEKASQWHTEPVNDDYSEFQIIKDAEPAGTVNWSLFGEHNADNALAAIIASNQVGIPPQQACEALIEFKSVKRRLQLLASVDGVCVYDDFAHHPTAIIKTLQALRKRIGEQRIIAVLEPRSNTMRLGVHKEVLAASLDCADQVYIYRPPQLKWDIKASLSELGGKLRVFGDTESIVNKLGKDKLPNDHILIMSNGGFENIHQRIIKALQHG